MGKQLLSVPIGCFGVYWLALGAYMIVIGLIPPPPDTRSDWAPWFMAVCGVGCLFLALFIIAAAVSLFKAGEEKEPPRDTDDGAARN